MLLPLVLVALGVFIPDVQPRGEPTASSRRVLEQLQVPADMRLGVAERQAARVALLRKAIATSPRDVFLHEAYQRARFGGVESNRQAVIEEYEALLAMNPRDAVFLYLAANAQVGRRTKDAIANLERAIGLAPAFGLPHALLADIYTSRAWADPGKVAEHMDRLVQVCPACVRVPPALRWSKDRDLVVRVASHLRKAIMARTDAEAVEAYPVLWSIEASLERSDHQDENRARMKDDVQRLLTPAFARNSAWLSALQNASMIQDGVDESARAKREVAALYPYSSAAAAVATERAMAGEKYPSGGTPEQVQVYWRRNWQAALPVSRQYPGSIGIAFDAARSVLQDRTSTPEQIEEVMAQYMRALQASPNGIGSLPPDPTMLADWLVERGVGLGLVPDLAAASFGIADRRRGPEAADDVHGSTGASLERERDNWYLWARLPFVEACARLGRLSEAKVALLAVEQAVYRMRPPENASSSDKFRHGELEARFWFLRGLVSEKDGRKLDALIEYPKRAHRVRATPTGRRSAGRGDAFGRPAVEGVGRHHPGVGRLGGAQLPGQLRRGSGSVHERLGQARSLVARPGSHRRAGQQPSAGGSRQKDRIRFGLGELVRAVPRRVAVRAAALRTFQDAQRHCGARTERGRRPEGDDAGASGDQGRRAVGGRPRFRLLARYPPWRCRARGFSRHRPPRCLPPAERATSGWRASRARSKRRRRRRSGPEYSAVHPTALQPPGSSSRPGPAGTSAKHTLRRLRRTSNGSDHHVSATDEPRIVTRVGPLAASLSGGRRNGRRGLLHTSTGAGARQYGERQGRPRHHRLRRARHLDRRALPEARRLQHRRRGRLLPGSRRRARRQAGRASRSGASRASRATSGCSSRSWTPWRSRARRTSTRAGGRRRRGRQARLPRQADRRRCARLHDASRRAAKKATAKQAVLPGRLPDPGRRSSTSRPLRRVHDGAIGKFAFGEATYHADDPFGRRSRTRAKSGTSRRPPAAWGSRTSSPATSSPSRTSTRST